MRRSVLLSVVVGLASVIAGCAYRAADEGAPPSRASGGGGGNASTPPAGSTPGQPGAACEFTPSNAIACDRVGPAVELDTSCADAAIDTTTGTFACNEGVPSIVVDQGAGKPKITVFFVAGLHVARDRQIRVVGDNALAIVSRGDVVVEGQIDASADNRHCTGGPGGYRGGAEDAAHGGDGAGPGGGHGNVVTAGSGGGSYGGAGGAGGAKTDEPSAGGAGSGKTYGASELVPLVGGSGGGGDDGCGGGGGGAIEIVSSTSITISTGAGINAGGASSYGDHGGGGSGGAILLEAPRVDIAGVLSANGAGGGYGCGALLDSAPACGGDGSGVGSSAIDPHGLPGRSGDAEGGGGGGGSGRIRINAHDGAAALKGVISPGVETGLASIGVLR